MTSVVKFLVGCTCQSITLQMCCENWPSNIHKCLEFIHADTYNGIGGQNNSCDDVMTKAIKMDDIVSSLSSVQQVAIRCRWWLIKGYHCIVPPCPTGTELWEPASPVWPVPVPWRLLNSETRQHKNEQNGVVHQKPVPYKPSLFPYH